MPVINVRLNTLLNEKQKKTISKEFYKIISRVVGKPKENTYSLALDEHERERWDEMLYFYARD